MCRIPYAIQRNIWRELGFLVFLYFAFSFSYYDFCTGMALHKDMSDEKTVIIQKEDNQKEIRVQTGDVIQIELEGTGSTGFWWHIDKLDTDHLNLLSEETKAVTEGKTGAPVMGIWRFKVHGKGYSEIKMDYYRKWEGSEKAAEHFLIKLNIN